MLNIFSFISLIEGDNKDKCLALLKYNWDLFSAAPGSAKKHHAWYGGYLNHIVETMDIATKLYEPLKLCGSLSFSLSDALLVLFLHDLEKPWKYGGNKHFPSKEARRIFRSEKIKEYEIELTSEHQNALRYVEGEDDYSPDQISMGPLAAFVHSCDVLSARIFGVKF